MFMQPGFACLEAGFCRAKNCTNLFTENVMDFAVGSLAFWVLGFGIIMGTDWKGLIGTSHFFLAGDSYDVGTYISFFWQLVFAATAATIVSGAIAERLKFQAYLVYSVVICLFIYPVCSHWVWGSGWLSKLPFGLGHLDFAGSGVVHAVGGLIGLAGAIVLGPRYGKFDKNGKPRAIASLWPPWVPLSCGSGGLDLTPGQPFQPIT